MQVVPTKRATRNPGLKLANAVGVQGPPGDASGSDKARGAQPWAEVNERRWRSASRVNAATFQHPLAAARGSGPFN